MAAAGLKEVMEEIYAYTQNVILGAAKQAAVESINSSVNNMISGGGAQGSLIITDPYEFIFTDTDREARLSVKSFLDSSLRGRGSGLNYIPAGMDEGISGNYYADLYRSALRVVEPRGASGINLDCCSNPRDPFAKGNWCCFNSLFLGNPIANPLGAQLVTERMLISEKEQREKLAMSQYQTGGGFRDVESNGQVVTPGSSIKDIQSNTTKLSFDTISGANSVPEVITALVTKLTTRVVREGIGNVQRNIQREFNSSSSFQNDIMQQINTSGPGSFFQPRY